MQKIITVSCLFGVIACQALSSELPRGSAPGPGKKFKFVSPKDSDIDCHTYHMNPEAGDLAFDPKNHKVYFLGHHKLASPDQKVKSQLIELDLKDLTMKKIVSLKVSHTAKLVAHKSPVEAITLLSFRGGTPGCGQGNAKGLGVKWVGKRRIIKTYEQAYYKLLPSKSGVKVLNRKDNVVRDFDLNTLQRRVTDSLPKKGMPLYLDMEEGVSFHYDQDGHGSVMKYDVLKQKLDSQMKLAEGMKVVQQQERFGVAKVNEEAGRITVNQIKGWSGRSYRTLRYQSKKLDVTQARLLVDFDSGLGLITGNLDMVAREWKLIEIYDGLKDKLLQEVKPPKDHYFATATMSPDGNHIVILAKHIVDYSLGAVSIYDVPMKKLKPVHLKF
ncbi:hypothetical protein [Pseudobacteriovorax antillogorgiicola]|uniref:Uncharacterized protein n=1 Tax=Pseudobacteriovorax antillogorgiicola TaxID=1513793 RepID=A0A1Y6CBB5_9BACT|nr:hypothetical protein [Pseudobacteriovorax antillogorgiicola]TCS48643.1 hypothetical protein EDD56_11765 [Pseudobacteriovorax antillogorgiicola]SMF55272.1 hypothetical protein SAMN06296036_11794 [Pseudobacteriovorax antillogorgiicola]